MNNTEEKQEYLRKNILDKGYDANEFSAFLSEKKDKYEEVDIGLWDFAYLKQFKCVEEFISLTNAKREQTKEDKKLLALSSIANDSKQLERISHYDINRSMNVNQKMKCEYAEETSLSKEANVIIELSSPEVNEETGFFTSKSYITYTVSTSPLDYMVKRKYSDFEWLRSILQTAYVSSVIPPLPKKLTESQYKEQLVAKSMRKIELFMQALILNPLIKRSQILFDFLAMTEANFELKKKFYSKLQSPAQAKEMRSISGEISINISSEQEIYLTNIKDNVNINEALLTKISLSYKELLQEMLGLAYRMKSISALWKQMVRSSEEYADNQKIINSYAVMSKLMSDWSEMQTKQAFIISNDIRDYFKFHRNEFKAFKPLITKVELAKTNYYYEEGRVTEKKEILFKKRDIAKWDLDPNNLENKEDLLNDKSLAFARMLPRETTNLNEMRELYGYFINSLIDEFQRLREINSKRHTERIQLFAKNHSNIISHMHISIADLISFISDKAVMSDANSA